MFFAQETQSVTFKLEIFENAHAFANVEWSSVSFEQLTKEWIDIDQKQDECRNADHWSKSRYC